MNILEKVLDFNEIDRDNIKIELMRDSNFAFFRGTSHLFFENLAFITKHKFMKSKKLLCYIQGDAHINNVGFSNQKCSSVKNVRFDINDFDEASVANPFLDIIRFGVSIGFFFDEFNNSDDANFRDINMIFQDTEMIEFFLKKYFKYVVNPKYKKYNWKKNKFMNRMRKKSLQRADSSNPKSRINKFTKEVDDRRFFDYENEKISKLSLDKELSLKDSISTVITDMEICEVCKRDSAGVGSAHLDRFYILAKYEEEYFLFEMKEQLKPSYLKYFPKFNRYLKYKKASKLHIEAKRKMIENADLHLYSLEYEKKDFLIKSIFNAKYSIDMYKLYGENIVDFEENLKEYLTFCAIALSNAHKKSSLELTDFIDKMLEIKCSNFYEIESIIFKSYATNVAMYSHFIRDLD